MDRTLYSEEHELFRKSFRTFLEREVVPHQMKWIEAGIVDREAWLKAGAAGFLLKDAPAAELARAIRAAHAGQRVVDPGLAAAALSQGENPLTAREREVLGESRHYGTIAELAAALHLSHGTTRNYLSAIMQKLDAHSRMEAIRVAEERGWL